MLMPALVGLLFLGATTINFIKCAAGSEKNVHFWFLPTESAIRVASDSEVFHDYNPQCVKITDEMYPCNKGIQYGAMRMPNLLGQLTVSEVKSFLYSFGGDEFLTCDPYARDFLCSLVTPLCFEQKPQFKIPPCRRLCEEVRDKCFYQLEDAGLGIPEPFNCSKFEDNELCLDPAKGQGTTDIPSPHPRRTTPPPPSPSEISPPTINTGYKDGSRIYNVSDIFAAVCYLPSQPSTIIVRGRLKSIREKRKGLYMKVREKNLKVFFDKFNKLGELEGVPTYNGQKLDQFFFRTHEDVVGVNMEELPVKQDVVYFFISRFETDESDEFFRVQYIVKDTGSAELRRLMNEVKDTEAPRC